MSSPPLHWRIAAGGEFAYRAEGADADAEHRDRRHHPPIGLNLFVISGISGTTMAEVVRGAFPFVFALLIVLLLLLLITFFPGIALVLL
jgi:hypothetical protein